MTGCHHKPESVEDKPEQPAADVGHEANVVAFRRANLRRIWKEWADDQIAIGRTRPKAETAAEKDEGEK